MLHQVLLVLIPRPKKTSSKRLLNIWCSFYFFFNLLLINIQLSQSSHWTSQSQSTCQYNIVKSLKRRSIVHYMYFFLSNEDVSSKTVWKYFCYLALYSCNDNYIDYNVWWNEQWNWIFFCLPRFLVSAFDRHFLFTSLS